MVKGSIFIFPSFYLYSRGNPVRFFYDWLFIQIVRPSKYLLKFVQHKYNVNETINFGFKKFNRHKE